MTCVDLIYSNVYWMYYMSLHLSLTSLYVYFRCYSYSLMAKVNSLCSFLLYLLVFRCYWFHLSRVNLPLCWLALGFPFLRPNIHQLGDLLTNLNLYSSLSILFGLKGFP